MTFHPSRLFRSVDPAWTVLFGLALLTGLHVARLRVQRQLQQEEATLKLLRKVDGTAVEGREHIQALGELKTSDLNRFKNDFTATAVSQKSLYEAGLSVQEERRLLEKQLEIMTTYLQVNPALQRVFLIRGAQPLQSYLISYFPLKAFGGASDALPPTVRVTSKERFANPERGASTMVNGQLVWTPPQVGTSVRSNALGEYVIFTNSRLILHGPPVNAEDHEKYPHVCLGLDREAARQLYRSTFIGTKIILANQGGSSE